MTKLTEKQRKQRQLAKITHGGYAWLESGVIPCDRCILKDACEFYRSGSDCQIILDYQDKVIQQIMSLPHIREEDTHLIHILVRELAFQAVITKYISREGLIVFKDGIINYQPILKLWYISINTTCRIMDSLGLSPQSRAKLGLVHAVGFDLARRMQELDEVKEGRDDKQ